MRGGLESNGCVCLADTALYVDSLPPFEREAAASDRTLAAAPDRHSATARDPSQARVELSEFELDQRFERLGSAPRNSLLARGSAAGDRSTRLPRATGCHSASRTRAAVRGSAEYRRASHSRSFSPSLFDGLRVWSRLSPSLCCSAGDEPLIGSPARIRTSRQK